MYVAMYITMYGSSLYSYALRNIIIIRKDNCNDHFKSIIDSCEQLILIIMMMKVCIYIRMHHMHI